MNRKTLLADFHMHSTFSDGKLTIPELVDLHGKLGFGAIAITDHVCEDTTLIGKAAALMERTLTRETFPRYLEILASEAERAKRLYGMIVIPGVELTQNSIVNSRSAHILGLGINQWQTANGSAETLLRGLRAQGAVTIAAHPVYTQKIEKQTYHLWDNRQELAPLFDAWEVASGPHLFDDVLKAKIPKIANSDLHHPKQIRSWKTLLRCEPTADAILQSIRDQELSFKFMEPDRLEIQNQVACLA